MVSHWDGTALVHRAVNACLCPLYAVDGMHVVTVEGGFLQRLRIAFTCVRVIV